MPWRLPGEGSPAGASRSCDGGSPDRTMEVADRTLILSDCLAKGPPGAGWTKRHPSPAGSNDKRFGLFRERPATATGRVSWLRRRSPANGRAYSPPAWHSWALPLGPSSGPRARPVCPLRLSRLAGGCLRCQKACGVSIEPLLEHFSPQPVRGSGRMTVPGKVENRSRVISRIDRSINDVGAGFPQLLHDLSIGIAGLAQIGRHEREIEDERRHTVVPPGEFNRARNNGDVELDIGALYCAKCRFDQSPIHRAIADHFAQDSFQTFGAGADIRCAIVLQNVARRSQHLRM